MEENVTVWGPHIALVSAFNKQTLHSDTDHSSTAKDTCSVTVSFFIGGSPLSLASDDTKKGQKKNKYGIRRGSTLVHRRQITHREELLYSC